MRTTLLAVALLMACGDSEPDYTLGEFCDEIATAICKRHVACGFSSFNTCFQGSKAGCCSNKGTCADPVEWADARDYIAVCVPSIRTQQCEEVENKVLPAVCLMSIP